MAATKSRGRTLKALELTQLTQAPRDRGCDPVVLSFPVLPLRNMLRPGRLGGGGRRKEELPYKRDLSDRFDGA